MRAFVALFAAIVFFGIFSVRAESKRVYRKILAHMPINLSPHMLEDEYSVQIMRQCIEGLLVLGDDNKLEAGVASDWTLSPDKKTYTFTIRENLKYSDGTPFRPVDFIKSIESVLKHDSILKSEMSVISGAEEFSSGKAASVKGLRVNGRKIEITLLRPFPPFLLVISAPEFGILKPADIENLRQKKVASFAALGPYYIKKIDEHKITLEKNPYYYRRDKIYFDEIQYDIAVSKGAAIDGFVNGKYYDIYPYEVPDDKAQAMGATKIATFSAMSWYIEFNLKKPIVRNLQFRRFLYKHFDFDGFLKAAHKPLHFRAYGLIPRGFLGFKEHRSLKEEVNDAKALAEAGCSASRPCELKVEHPYPELQVPLQVGFKKITDRFRAVRINVRLEERSPWYQRFVSGDYSMIVVGNTSRYPDTSLFLKYLSNPKYHPGLDIKEIAPVLAASLATDDRSERRKLFERADDLLFDQMGIIPLFFGETPYRWVSPRLNAFVSPPLGFSKVRIDRLSEKEKP